MLRRIVTHRQKPSVDSRERTKPALGAAPFRQPRQDLRLEIGLMPVRVACGDNATRQEGRTLSGSLGHALDVAPITARRLVIPNRPSP